MYIYTMGMQGSFAKETYLSINRYILIYLCIFKDLGIYKHTCVQSASFLGNISLCYTGYIVCICLYIDKHLHIYVCVNTQERIYIPMYRAHPSLKTSADTMSIVCVCLYIDEHVYIYVFVNISENMCTYLRTERVHL